MGSWPMTLIVELRSGPKYAGLGFSYCTISDWKSGHSVLKEGG